LSDEIKKKLDEECDKVMDNDLQRLEPEVYLNDSLINFHLKLTELAFITEERRSRVHIFNTYFMPKMRNLFNDINNDFTKFDQVYQKLERVRVQMILWGNCYLLIIYLLYIVD
jgi:hypothetical protein